MRSSILHGRQPGADTQLAVSCKASAVSTKTEAAITLHFTALTSPHQHCYPIARGNTLAVGRDDNIAIRARRRCNVARTLPAHQLYLRTLKLAGKNCGQEALQSCLAANLGLELCV